MPDTAQYPSFNDREFDLIKKITNNTALISQGGEVGEVTSVNGRSGAVTLTSTDVGLGNVENTALSTWAGSTNITTAGALTATTLKLPATTGDKLQVYAAGVSARYGMGINAFEWQYYLPNTAHWSWNNGGDLSASGTNELMRLSGVTGALLIGTATDDGPHKLQVAGGIALGTVSSMATLTSTSGALAIAAAGTDKGVSITNSGQGSHTLVARGITLTVSGGVPEKVTIFDAGHGVTFETNINGNTNLSAFYATHAISFNASGSTTQLVALTSGAVCFGTASDNSNGRLQIVTHTTIAGGIGFGTDVAIYRSATNALTIGASAGLTLTGAITTSAPTVGTAAAWNLGTYTADVVTTQTGVVRINIAGVSYKLLAST